MRLAAVVLASVLLPSTSAHADAILNVSLPEAPLPVSSSSPLAEEAIASPASLVLPAETGALLLSTQTGTGVTPEPSSVVLMGSGLLGFGALVWRRRVVSRAIDTSAS